MKGGRPNKPKAYVLALVTIILHLLPFLFYGNHIFAQDQLESNYIILWDGLESKNNWDINAQDRLDLSSEYKTEGQTSLEIKVKSAIDRNLTEGIALKREKAFLNIESAKSIILDIYNKAAPFNLVLVLNIDGFHKSFPKRIERGLNENIIFELKARSFNPPFRPDSIAQNLLFVIYPEKDILAPIYFDNIRIHLYGGTEFLTGISPTIGDLVAEGYTPPETPPVEHLYALPGWSAAETPLPPVIYELKTLFLFGIGLVGLVFCHKYK